MEMLNNSYIFEYKEFKENIGKTPVKNADTFFETHPNKYSLKALKDFFTLNGIESKAYNLPFEYLDKIHAPFIVQLKNPSEFVVICSKGKNFVTIHNKKGCNKLPLNELNARYNGNILKSFNKKEVVVSSGYLESLKSNKNKKLNAFNILALTILLMQFIAVSTGLTAFYSFFVPLLLTLPLFVSNELLSIQYGQSNSVSEKLCNFSEKTDCQITLNSNLSRKFKGKLAHIGFSYVLYLSVLSLFLTYNGVDFTSIIKHITFFCMITTPFSLYLILYQLFKLRKICPLCFFVNGFNVLTGSLFFVFDFSLNFYFAPITIAALFTILISTLYHLSVFSQFEKNYLYRELLKNKRKPAVFFANIEHLNNLVEVNKDQLLISRIMEKNITFLLDLSCEKCISSVKEYEYIMNHIPEIGLSISIILQEKHIDSFNAIIEKIYNTHINNGDWFGLLKNWYSSSEFRKNSIGQTNQQTYTNKAFNFSKKLAINYTPIILYNNKVIPQEYSYYDIADMLTIQFG